MGYAPSMETKLSKLKAAYAAGDYREALRIAARFPQLGAEKEAICRAWQAIQSPAFYREIGRDPELLIAQGVAALKKRYAL